MWRTQRFPTILRSYLWIIHARQSCTQSKEMKRLLLGKVTNAEWFLIIFWKKGNVWNEKRTRKVYHSIKNTFQRYGQYGKNCKIRQSMFLSRYFWGYLCAPQHRWYKQSQDLPSGYCWSFYSSLDCSLFKVRPKLFPRYIGRLIPCLLLSFHFLSSNHSIIILSVPSLLQVQKYPEDGTL